MTTRKPGLWTSVVGTPFLICALILTSAALGRVALVDKLKLVTRKEPIPLRKPLPAMRERFGTYELRENGRNHLSGTLENSLGTEEYLDWRLRDTSIPRATDPRRHVRLFVTYYTGGPNLAPHTPDVCFVSGGYQPRQPHENRVIDVPALGDDRRKVPVRVCTFVKTAIFDRNEPTVIYTFSANNTFVATAGDVRAAVTRIRDKHAYFCKVEVSFGGPGCHPRNLGREESIAAATRLFDAVLPVLVDEHWPDWDKAQNTAPGDGD